MAVLTNAQILTNIASTTTNSALKEFITNHTNLEIFGNLIISDEFQLEKNALLTTLVNGISKRIVNTRIMKNKLKELKGDKIPYGSQVNEIIANPAKATPYDMTSTDLLTQKYADVKSVFYRINRQDKYMVTISDVQLQRALIQPNGLSELIQMVVGTLYSGDNVDEMMLTKQLVTNAVLNNKVKKVILKYSGDSVTDPASTMTIETIEFPTNATKNIEIKEFIRALRTYAYNFEYASSNYNAYDSVKGETEKSLVRDCPMSDQVLLLRTDILATADVELLATAFNMSKTDFLQKVIPVDDFNGFDIWGILCDKAWFRINDTHYSIREFQNGSNLTTNYYLHHHGILSYNLLSNAVVFISSKDETLHNV